MNDVALVRGRIDAARHSLHIHGNLPALRSVLADVAETGGFRRVAYDTRGAAAAFRALGGVFAELVARRIERGSD